MIATLKGSIVESRLLQVVIEAGGVGYEVNIPIKTAENLPPIGSETKLFIYPIYRDDSQTLYGFLNRKDRDFFKVLVEKVSGVGPKMALMLFSRLSIRLLQGAIVRGDAKLLAQCRGIGKKTAERIIIELRDQVKSGLPSPSPAVLPAVGDGGAIPAGTNLFQDAISALGVLGYKAVEADKAVNRAMDRLGPEASLEDIIKQALSG
ncbi:MAG: Holliday junction branch migration protein RuvA [Opitutae bacterium]|nr:Holliday junction branch migration protein RuvA [Opitutae bacterium]MBC9889158.1 Holliday junction branch migration protein RuvA [Opitutae bacterium]